MDINHGKGYILRDNAQEYEPEKRDSQGENISEQYNKKHDFQPKDHADEKVAEARDLLRAATDSVTHRQMAIGSAKMELDTNEQMARHRVNFFIDKMQRMTNSAKHILESQIQKLATRRRAEMEAITSELASLHPKLMKMSTELENQTGN